MRLPPRGAADRAHVALQLAEHLVRRAHRVAHRVLRRPIRATRPPALPNSPTEIVREQQRRIYDLEIAQSALEAASEGFLVAISSDGIIHFILSEHSQGLKLQAGGFAPISVAGAAYRSGDAIQ